MPNSIHRFAQLNSSVARYPSPTLNTQYPQFSVALGLERYPIAVSRKAAAYWPQVWPGGGLKIASSEGAHVIWRSWSSVAIMPEMRRAMGSRGLSHACQNLGIRGREMVTPQKRPKVIMMGGFNRFAMNALGVIAATICPRVMEKN